MITPICASCLNWSLEKTRRFSRLAGQGLILALDTIFLAGKITQKVPEVVTKATLVALSGVGFVSLPYTLDLVRKTIHDALFGYRADNRLVMLLATAKVIELVSNLGLLALGAVASVEGLKGNNQTQTNIYDVMIPWGEATIGLSISMMLAYMLMNYKALKELTEERTAELISGFQDENGNLASLVRFSMDKDTLEHFLNKLAEIPEEEHQELVKVLIENIEVQQRINTGGQLVLVVGGYILMGVEKYYTPNSIESAGINVGVAGAYALKVLVETLQEVWQRHRISGLL